FGDEVYGSKATHRLSSAIGYSPPRQQLHAWKLGFTHPITGEPIEHVAAPPEDFQVTLESLAESSQIAVQALRP
ncbi:MAG: RluA family pseudouridine synthase, partial [Limisphaerales bacterium]